MKASRNLVCAFGSAVLTSCGTRNTDDTRQGSNSEARVAAAAAVIDDVQTRFRRPVYETGHILRAKRPGTMAPKGSEPIVAGVANVAFEAREGALIVRAKDSGGHAVRADVNVSLPTHALGSMRLTTPNDCMAIEAALEGVKDAPAEIDRGLVVYRGTHAGGGTIIHRAGAFGTEDYAFLPQPLAEPSLSYTIGLVRGVASLRVVDRHLEFLDEGGTPRLRVDPPSVIDAKGVTHAATLDVVGCAVDRDPRAPWGRVHPAPGATSCRMVVRWSKDLAHPILVDPTWVATTNTMTSPRWGHAQVTLPDNKVLVAGGWAEQSGTGTPTPTADLFDPATRTFSATNPMPTPRAQFAFAALPSGKVLVAGGYVSVALTATVSTPNAETFDPATSTWTSVAPMSTARGLTRGLALDDGRVLVAGGVGRASSETFNESTGWSSLTTTFRERAGFVLEKSGGYVLATGGDDEATAKSAQTYDQTTNRWVNTAAMSVSRPESAGISIGGGRILVAGGYIPDYSIPPVPGTYHASAEIWNGATGTWTAAPKMIDARSGFPLVRHPSGMVLALGGQAGGTILSSSELYDPVTNTWRYAGAMTMGRSEAEATATGDNVLVTGGRSYIESPRAAVPTAELYVRDLGEACTNNSQCGSSFCVDGVCCNTACGGTVDTDCQACSMAKGATSDGTCSVLPTTSVCRPAADLCDAPEMCNGTDTTCPTDINRPAGFVCRGALSVCDVDETCSGTSKACPTDVVQPATIVCRAAAGDCDVAENCTGTSGACPTDGFTTAGTVCRAAAGICDVAEACTGTAAACPTDSFAPSTVECRPAVGACDPAEMCNGTMASCPTDLKAPDGQPCSDGLVCNGSETCTAGTCTPGAAVACGDENVCTTDVCNEPSGTCSHALITDCCRTAADCNDGNSCTSDECTSNKCVHTSICDAGSDASDASDATEVSDASDASDAEETADTEVPDTAIPDSGPQDEIGPKPDADAAADTTLPEEPPTGDTGSGCGCRTASSTPANTSLALASLAIAAVIARRRRGRRAA